ncbi:MAG: hypothetical protein IPJ26_12100 [Bacteroidetes bacterium]|nr:hypothetical protein [Bacteroidota bacterium]
MKDTTWYFVPLLPLRIIQFSILAAAMTLNPNSDLNSAGWKSRFVNNITDLHGTLSQLYDG